MDFWKQLRRIINDSEQTASEAESTWYMGWKLWRNWLAAEDEIEAEKYSVRASLCFERCLQLEPDMADAALGLHAVSASRRAEMLQILRVHGRNLGQMQALFEAPIRSTWRPLLFAVRRLEVPTDIWLASSVLAAEEGNYLRAEKYLQEGSGDRQTAKLVKTGILFREQRYEECLQHSAGLGSSSAAIQTDLEIIEGVCWRETGEDELSVESLRAAADKSRNNYSRAYARYELGKSLVQAGEISEGERQLRWSQENASGFEDIDDIIRERSWQDIISSYYSEEVADEPDISDNH